MKIKTSELTKEALNFAVGIADGGTKNAVASLVIMGNYNPSTDWSQGGPITEREKLQPSYQQAGKYKGLWACNKWVTDAQGATVAIRYYGETLLIAAMRCYVATKLGGKIEVPDELFV
jgi:hypothetical protein